MASPVPRWTKGLRRANGDHWGALELLSYDNAERPEASGEMVRTMWRSERTACGTAVRRDGGRPAKGDRERETLSTWQTRE